MNLLGVVLLDEFTIRIYHDTPAVRGPRGGLKLAISMGETISVDGGSEEIRVLPWNGIFNVVLLHPSMEKNADRRSHAPAKTENTKLGHVLLLSPSIFKFNFKLLEWIVPVSHCLSYRETYISSSPETRTTRLSLLLFQLSISIKSAIERIVFERSQLSLYDFRFADNIKSSPNQLHLRCWS